MTERSEYRFTPEEWDGHTSEDSCPWRRGSDEHNLPEYIEAERFANTTLQQFLGSNHLPLRRFRRGEIFQGNHNTHGAIVGYSMESYVFGTPAFQEPPYATDDYWGVVCSFPNKRPVIISYWTNFANKNDVGMMTAKNSLTEGETIHQRDKTYDDPDVLLRYKDIIL